MHVNKNKVATPQKKNNLWERPKSLSFWIFTKWQRAYMIKIWHLLLDIGLDCQNSLVVQFQKSMLCIVYGIINCLPMYGAYTETLCKLCCVTTVSQIMKRASEHHFHFWWNPCPYFVEASVTVGGQTLLNELQLLIVVVHSSGSLTAECHGAEAVHCWTFQLYSIIYVRCSQICFQN